MTYTQSETSVRRRASLGTSAGHRAGDNLPAHSYIYENVFEEKCRKVIRALDDAGGSMGHSALLRKSHESNDVFKKVIETLYEAGNIEIDIDRGKTKPSKIYRLVLR